ncbi:MAG: leucyl/phenylalanyl-tRNA--protein transferase [Pedobacter sp.]|jgi:leucyl/phenylalanyl-tRNA--protein transferase
MNTSSASMQDLKFPDPETSDNQGLLVIGGDLSPQRVLQAYSQGVFPWYNPGTPVLWWSPNPRLILIPAEFKLSHSLKKSLKKSYRFSTDTAFLEVITACATCSDRTNKTWITHEMIETYTQLHAMGYAHSFEIWQEDKLVGGLYGISLGRAFFGESMFHIVTDASKIAFYYLCHTMAAWDFHFIDCQIPSNHLHRLGAKIINRSEFLRLLHLSLEYPTKQGVWHTAPQDNLYL